MSSPTRKTALLVVMCLAVGAGIGVVATEVLHRHKIPADVREFNNQYHFINPLLACGEDLNNLDNDKAKKLQRDMEQTITRHKEAGDVTEVSVYYRDLIGGPWVGIDFEKTFSPGSLLKVPLAMSLFKKAESDPKLFEKKLNYTGEETNDPQFFAPIAYSKGQHTVAELIEQMLVYSDNNATNELAKETGAIDFQATYDHLGVVKPPIQGSDYELSTHDYASFFRILYNATYLNHQGSERLLTVLSKSAFKQGLVAGVPSDVVVAHKFGERAFMNSNVVQLHDCGIVYVPNHPYLLCVMTRGKNFPALATVIADISRLAYNYAK